MLREYQCAAVPQHENNEACAEKLAHRMGRSLAHGHAACGAPEGVRAGVETCAHLLLGRKGFYYAHSAKCFLELRHGVAPLVLRVERLVFQLAPYLAHYPAHKREHYYREKGKFPARIDKHAEIANYKYGIFYEHFKRTGHGVFNLVYVAAHAGYDVALALVGEKRKRQRYDFVVNVYAYVAHNSRAHGHKHSGRGKVTARLHERG